MNHETLSKFIELAHTTGAKNLVITLERCVLCWWAGKVRVQGPDEVDFEETDIDGILECIQSLEES